MTDETKPYLSPVMRLINSMTKDELLDVIQQRLDENAKYDDAWLRFVYQTKPTPWAKLKTLIRTSLKKTS